MNIGLMIIGIIMCIVGCFCHASADVILWVFGLGGIAVGFSGMTGGSSTGRDFDACMGDRPQRH